VETEVPAGTQTEFRIVGAAFDPTNNYGPQIELKLELTEEQYLGVSMTYWASIQQPRLDKVRKWRKDGLDDETIASALKKQGFEFENIDEPDSMRVGRGGNLYKLITAIEGSTKGAEAVLERYDTFDELAECMVDGTFVGTTKRSADGKYCKLDGNEDFFPVASKVLASEKETEDELDELPDLSDEDEDAMNKALG